MRRPIYVAVALPIIAVVAVVTSLLAGVFAGSGSTRVSVSAATAAIQPTTFDQLTEHAYLRAKQSVVYVDNVGTGTGSGIIYDANGDIVTNNHVVDGAQTIKVTVSNGKVYTATLIGRDTADDLAVIRISAPNLVPAQFADSSTAQVAQNVLAVGNPLGLKQTVTSGVISGLDRTEQEQNGAYLPDALQTSAPINPGNSGGALVTLTGSVVGMPTLEQTSTGNGSSAQNIGFAIPSNRIVSIANQLISTGKVEHTGRAYLGVSVGDSSGSSGGQFGFGFGGSQSTVEGAAVQNVDSSSPAGKAGIQVGDVITQANGTTITSADDLLTVLAQSKPGASLTLTVNHNGQTTHDTVTLGELKAG